jgi:hypothetical protein
VGAAAVLLLVWRSGDLSPSLDGVRIKGPLALGVVVQRASGGTDRIASGASVAAGDVLRFELAHGQPGHAAVLGLDERQVVSLYVPQDGHLPFLAGAGKTVLPGAVKLDDAPGVERIFALLCPDPLPPEQLRQRARDCLAASSGRPAEVKTLELPCSEAAFLITKEIGP